MDIRSIAIIGSGAVGGFYGAKLQNAGYQVEYFSKFLNSGRLKIKAFGVISKFPLKYSTTQKKCKFQT
jgi:prephenate dehydrogenase